MSAFSYQYHHPFLLDSVFFPYPPTPTHKVSGFSEQPNTTTTTTCFPQFHTQPDPIHGMTMDFSAHESNCLEHGTKVTAISNNEPSVANKQSPDSSSVVLDQKIESGEQVTQMNKKRKYKNGSSLNSAQSKDTREMVKWKKQKKSNGSVMKDVEEKKPRGADKKDEKKVSEEAPVGYIHVRARRGQATDSHSLAERVRREKISERMKLLQALVPGCDKVTGKALMLGEIINYVQSLQNQVEFLSMKLASLNPMFFDFGVDLDAFMAKPENLNSLAPPAMPHVQQCSPSGPTNTFTTAKLIFQSNGQLLWDMDDQRQKLIYQSALGDNLCSFH